MLNLDTHMVVALLEGELSIAEHDLLANEQLGISDIVLWELAKLVQLGKLELNLDDARFQEFIRHCTVFPITIDIARQSTKLDFRSDPADEVIAATSIVEAAPLLTRDRRIRKSRMVPFAG